MTVDGWLASKSANFRSQIRRSRRQLEAQGAAARRAATVALPVHQELTGEHLERMAAVVRELDPEPSPLVARPARG
jgi:hypothetical protein